MFKIKKKNKNKNKNILEIFLDYKRTVALRFLLLTEY